MSALALFDTRYDEEDEKLSTTYNYKTVKIHVVDNENEIRDRNTILFSHWPNKRIKSSLRPTELFNIPSQEDNFENFFPNKCYAERSHHLKISEAFVNQILTDLKELREKHIIHSVDYLYENLEPALCQEKFQECNSLYSAITKCSEEYHEQIFVTMLSIATRWREHFERYNDFFVKTEKKLLEKHSEKEVNKILKGWKKYVG